MMGGAGREGQIMISNRKNDVNVERRCIFLGMGKAECFRNTLLLNNHDCHNGFQGFLFSFVIAVFILFSIHFSITGLFDNVI